MKLEYGKRYVTRDGRVTTPLEPNPIYGSNYPFMAHVDDEPRTWAEHGSYSLSSITREERADLVAEYPEPLAGSPPHFYVFNPEAGKPTVKHATLAEAEQEALRLASLNPGHCFEILECRGIASCSTPSVFWNDCS